MANYSCVVCEWSESHHKSPVYPKAELYNHFRTPGHLKNWRMWCTYYHEQKLADDYIEDWLKQHQLLALHRNAVADAGYRR